MQHAITSRVTIAASLPNKAFTIGAHTARVVLGLIFLLFGMNGFLNFIPMPPHTGVAGEFMFGLSKAPYMFPVVFLFQLLSGVVS